MKISFWSRLLDLISPRSCGICGQRLSITENSVCTPCYLHLPRTTYQWTPLDNPMAQLFWGLAPVHRAAALFFFQPHSEAANLIYLLKYNDRPDIGEDLGRMMAEEMRMAGFFDGMDAIIPVPLTRHRQRQRGYNQSEMVARGISTITGLPVMPKVLRRKAFQTSQTSLMRHQRLENVEDIFELHDGCGLEGKHILLVDDICTTGATLASCANTLKVLSGLEISVLTLGFTQS